MKKSPVSFIAVIIIILALIGLRIFYFQRIYHTFEWDSLGYYLYLPSHYIYHDMAYLKFYPDMLAKYHFPGTLYQAQLQPGGKYVFYYEIGLSILQTPFFFIGHWLAGWLHYPQDGFSFPYQLSICAGTFFYICLGLFVLRKILLRYFSDSITAWTLLLITLATDFPQYISIDAGMTHGYLFTLLCILIWATIKWHDKPTLFYTALIGFLIGFIAAIRITDAVMLFIPLLWNTQTKELRIAKMNFIKQHPFHVVVLAMALAIPILPQLIYWKYVTGSWIYPMGSKWEFLLPHISVLFGWENGWFIYTPVTILIVMGLFFLKKSDYKRSVITYFLLNLWIIIAWHDYRYGAPYSTRALMQSLAIMSLPLGNVLEKASKIAWQKMILIFLSIYLCFVNFFQIWQFNKAIITYDDMNRLYYSAIYLNPSPSPIDMSMIDTDERLKNEKNYHLFKTIQPPNTYHLNGAADSISNLYSGKLSEINKNNTTKWLKISVSIKSDWGAFDTYLITELTDNSQLIKKRTVRMQNGICSYTNWNKIEYYFKIPADQNSVALKIYCKTSAKENIEIKDFELLAYTDQDN